MSNNFYKILTEILLSIVIAILLPTIGMLFWLLKDNSGNIILTLLIALLIIVLFVVLYYYYKNCTSSTELIVLKLIQESTDVTNVIENIIRTDLTTKVEVIWYKEIQTQVEEYNSSLERYETVLKNIEDILHKEIIEDIFITEDKTEISNINKEKQFTLIFIEEEFRFNKDAIKYVQQKIESIDRLYKNKSSRRRIKYNIGLTTEYDRILLNKNMSKIDWWIIYGKIFYWIFSLLLLNVPYRIWLNKYFNCQKLLIKKVGTEIMALI